MTETDYERVLLGEARIHIVGDLGTFFPVPALDKVSDKEKLYYSQKYAFSPKGSSVRVHSGGQTVLGLLALDIAKVTCIDYAPDCFEQVLHGICEETIGHTRANEYLLYMQITKLEWGVKDALAITIQNTINLIKEEMPEDVVFDARDRFWYNDLFPGWMEMNLKLHAATDNYMTPQEKQAREELRLKKQGQQAGSIIEQ